MHSPMISAASLARRYGLVETIPLRSLLNAFVAADAAVILGTDETVDWRRGGAIAARGIYHDAVL